MNTIAIDRDTATSTGAQYYSNDRWKDWVECG